MLLCFLRCIPAATSACTVTANQQHCTFPPDVLLPTPLCAGDEDDGDDAAGGDGEEDDDVEDAAAAAAKQAKAAAAGKRGKGTAAREEATLASADALRQKKVDNTFAVDPLFHKMSALFDEGGAKGEQGHEPAVAKLSLATIVIYSAAVAPASACCRPAAAQPQRISRCCHHD
jgi:hypothetical protein